LSREEDAKRLLENDLFQEAFETLRTELMTRWENSTSNETEAREQIWLGLQLLQRVRRHLESILETGQLDRARQEQSPFI
jgi:hypothetical protein